MECAEFKLAVGADPRRLSSDARDHISSCPACARYAQDMQGLDHLLHRALQLPVVRGRPPIAQPRRDRTSRWFALAASLLITAGFAAGIWVALPRYTLASEVIEHVSAEQDIVGAAQPLSSRELNAVLRRSGVRLNGNRQHQVWYATTCPFRGHEVPHLIVQTAQGRVTVLLLADEHVREVQKFDEQGFRGTILPSGAGSIAIIAMNQAAIEEAAAHVAEAVEWIK